jgi:two-component system, NtrC family, response regulator GlrR
MVHGSREASTDALHSDLARLNLLGRSPAFLELLRLVRRCAVYDATVLICGETGSGKEVVARALHYLGPRSNAPFIPVNCGAIPDALLENELFGHARGAYTDAREPLQGLVARAEGGTLFLDEIEAMTSRAQVTMLRFLQDHEYRPLGANLSYTANVRVIAASNADLERMVEQGVFRMDLLYRLSVLNMRVPPLRERIGDPCLLAEEFLRRLSLQYGRPPKRLHPDTVAALDGFHWPGNVRQLENFVHRAYLLVDEPVIRISPGGVEQQRAPAGAASASGLTAARFQDAKARTIAQFERAYITELLERSRGNISLAARIAGKERSRLAKLVKKYGLERHDFVR